MSVEQKESAPLPDLAPAVRYYLFIGFAGLLILGLALFEKIDLFAALPVVLGGLGLLPALAPPDTAVGRLARKFPAHAMPPLVVFTLVLVAMGYPTWFGRGLLEFTDILLGVGLLAYLAGQYRVLGLRHQAVPADPRPRAGRFPTDGPETWPAKLARPQDLVVLGVALLVALALGQLAWYWVVSGGEWSEFQDSAHDRQFLDRDRLNRTDATEPPYVWERPGVPPTEVAGRPPSQMDLKPAVWRFASLVWLLGIGAVVVTSFLGTLRTYRMTGDEARMIGQDALWTETRGEQRRTTRWLAWARRKWFRKTGQQP
jgi:hypothetical protein